MVNRKGLVVLVFVCFLASTMFSLKANALELRTTYGSTSTCDYKTDGIYAIWWDKNWDYSQEAQNILYDLNVTRNISINEFGMEDPPGSNQYYYNVYIHNGDDLFPDGWAMGQGTDSQGYPYLTIPNGAANCTPGANGCAGSICHEGFHIFQYNADSFPYSGDSGWYIEATANWFTHYAYPNDYKGTGDIPAFTLNPQLSLWATFENQNNPPSNWSRWCHQYGAQIWIIYLTNDLGFSGHFIGYSFYSGTNKLPQEYLYDELADRGYDMREVYADFSARAVTFDIQTLDADYLKGQEEYWANQIGNDDHRIVAEYNNAGTNGWITPPGDYSPAGWAYNTYKINNSSTGSYTFELDGSNTGVSGFRGRIVVVDGNNRDYYDLNMSNESDGNRTVNVSTSDETIYFVVSSVPNDFTGNETYSYSIRVTKDDDGQDSCTAPEPGVTGTSADSISLAWNNAGADSYIVYYKTTDGSWVTAVSGLTATSYTITGLADNTAYDIAVRSICPDGTSPYNIISASTSGGSDGDDVTINDVLGQYVRQPPANSWHTGIISMVGNTLQWENQAGVSWPLFPDLDEGKLFTNEECPYFEADGGDAFTLVLDQNNDGSVEVEGFMFIGEFYSR